jgi:hypothetical protein
MRNMSGRLLVFSVIAVLAALAPATTTAHFTEVFQGDDHGTNDHSHFNIYDNECDGNRVYGIATDATGLRGPAYDPDGCGGDYRHLDGLNFTTYAICEEGVACSQTRET